MAGVVWELIVYYNPCGEFYRKPVRHALYETREKAEQGWVEFQKRKDFRMDYVWDEYKIQEVEVL